MAIETTSDLSLVGTSQIVDGSVTSAKIAAGAVGTAAISSGAATSGQILQANGSGAVSFATLASGGGMTLIATATPSAATSLSFTSIPTTYKDLVIIYRNVSQSVANSHWGMRLNNDSTASSYHANYYTQLSTTVDQWIGGAQDLFPSSAKNAPICTTGTSADSLWQRGHGVIRIYRYTELEPRLVQFYSSGYGTTAPNYTQCTGLGVFNRTVAAVTQIDFIRNTTQTITGNFYLYGVS